MILNDLSNMITIRNYLNGIIDSLAIKLSREQVKSIQEKVRAFDIAIVERSLKIDFSVPNFVEIAKSSQINNEENDIEVKTVTAAANFTDENFDFEQMTAAAKKNIKGKKVENTKQLSK